MIYIILGGKMELNFDQCLDLWVKTYFLKGGSASVVFFTEVGCGQD